MNLPATNGIVLNEDQNKALNILQEWSYSDKPFHTLSGSAGTGKTTLLKFFIKDNKYRSGQIGVTAPTHKAKKVAEQATGLEGRTIQSLLGLRPNTDLINFDVNKPQFAQMADQTIDLYRLIIVDESSMLNKNLVSQLKKEARNSRVKLLFVGDELQLPPVNEEKSLVFYDYEIPVTRLTHIVRQAESNPLARVLDALRSDIENGTDKAMVILANEPYMLDDDGEGYEVHDKMLFTDRLLKDFTDDRFRADQTFCKYTAWTNNSISKWNRGIRNELFHTEEPLVSGDLLMGYTTVQPYRGSVIITNSEEYIVQRVNPHQTDRSVPGYLIDLYGIDSGEEVSGLFIVDPSNTIKYTEIFKALLKTAKQYRGRAWKPFYEFKEKNLIIRDVKNEIGLVSRKDLDYGYGVTVHKTQGSTYENVYVNGIDINRNSDPTERRKLWYVALSRARKKAIILL